MPRMQTGGIVEFDEYNHPRQVGETIAADEACARYGLRLERRSVGADRSAPARSPLSVVDRKQDSAD
ncbi:hypothetical protein [Micromonospora sp. LOL_024]|uniref:hypothetical protein n=1 Tax=Micromonospora sp. LOL_024 TaxID=3345412 RepID=UPI003A8495B0